MKFKPYQTIGESDLRAIQPIFNTGILSGYIGAPGKQFSGGPFVQKLEEESQKLFGVKHCIAVNSWTSGLICALGSIGIEPGNEVIVTPWTMVASATCILHWNAIPVFVAGGQFSNHGGHVMRKGETTCDIYLSILQEFGIKREQFGNSRKAIQL